MELLVIAVIGLLGVAGAAAVAPRARIAAPLILVLAGIVVSFIPAVPVVDIDPEWIIAGVLPPLLYSASVSMPAMNFRREFGAISGLSVVLVVVSAVILGVFFSWVIPDLSLWWGIALGAIVSPTDAVATGIVKRIGVGGRTVSVLEGESLLNDATALVLLRAAVAGAAASVSLWGVVGDFAFAVVVALVIGFVVGKVNLWVRARVKDSTVNTVVSFTVPFLASIPAEMLGASGLVAAVVAGLVTGHGAARRLPPQHRLSDRQNWSTIELVLEGFIFLVMGLEIAGIVADVDDGFGLAALVAAGALFITVFVRTAYIAPLLVVLSRRAARGAAVKARVVEMREQGVFDQLHRRGREFSEARTARFATRIRRGVADIDYYLEKPLGWREGGILVWAGMRGAVTLAAAQTLPPETPSRSLLILIAFLVAVGSLLLQGSTLAAVVRWLLPASDPHADDAERGEVIRMLRAAEASVPADAPHRMLAVIAVQRSALLDARDDGTYDAETLNGALANLDATQISIEMRGTPPEA